MTANCARKCEMNGNPNCRAKLSFGGIAIIIVKLEAILNPKLCPMIFI
jgi:hypothetical protein